MGEPAHNEAETINMLTVPVGPLVLGSVEPSVAGIAIVTSTVEDREPGRPLDALITSTSSRLAARRVLLSNIAAELSLSLRDRLLRREPVSGAFTMILPS